MEHGTVAVAWSKEAPFGAEYAEVSLSTDALSASGIAIGSEPLPHRLDCTLRTGSGFVTDEVEVLGRGDGWERRLTLARSPARPLGRRGLDRGGDKPRTLYARARAVLWASSGVGA